MNNIKILFKKVKCTYSNAISVSAYTLEVLEIRALGLNICGCFRLYKNN